MHWIINTVYTILYKLCVKKIIVLKLIHHEYKQFAVKKTAHLKLTTSLFSWINSLRV